MKASFLVLVFLSLSISVLRAQDTLPEFSVRNVGGDRYIVSWTNTFETVKQISIQRSFDSLSGYKTILTVPDPRTPQNGFVDSKAPNDHMFYRLYILLDKGMYLFSKAKRPLVDTVRRMNYSNKTEPAGGIDSVSVPNFGINNRNGVNVFVPSLHVYTHRDGYVRINLPEDGAKKYSIKFYEEGGKFLFELKDLKTRSFRIDKANFYRGGWFRFELFEDDQLIENHKFYLQKDF